jgi:hypothetical protein
VASLPEFAVSNFRVSLNEVWSKGPFGKAARRRAGLTLD